MLVASPFLGVCTAVAAPATPVPCRANATSSWCVGRESLADRRATPPQALAAKAAELSALAERNEDRVQRWSAECSVLRSKLERRTKEVLDLGKMLKAWESMRASKDQTIGALLDKVNQLESELAHWRVQGGAAGASPARSSSERSAGKSPAGLGDTATSRPPSQEPISQAAGAAPAHPRPPRAPALEKENAGLVNERPKPPAAAAGAGAKRALQVLLR